MLASCTKLAAAAHWSLSLSTCQDASGALLRETFSSDWEDRCVVGRARMPVLLGEGWEADVSRRKQGDLLSDEG